MTIDARELMQRYEDFEWARGVHLERLAICRMGAREVGDGDEEYVVEAEVPLP